VGLVSGGKRRHDVSVSCITDLNLGRARTSETSAIQSIHMHVVLSSRNRKCIYIELL
jgi:hypothetical protein